MFNESRSVLQKIAGYQDFGDEPGTSTGKRDLQDELTSNSNWYRENVGLYSDLGFNHSLAPSDSILGFVLKHLGRYDLARRQGEQGLNLARRIGWRQEEGLALNVLGEVALAEDDFDNA